MEQGIVRSAVVGAGLLGTIHAEFLAKQEKAMLAAVADVRLEAAEKVAGETGAKAYTSYEEMLTEEKLDLVVIETPDHLHRACAVACCQAGVPNLVIQKPLSTTIEDAKVILDAASASGTRVLVWYGNRTYGTDMATQYAIRSGLIGKVVHGDCITEDNIGVPLLMWGERSRDWVASSSPANFLATHTVDRLYWYFAPARIKRVYAIKQTEVLGYTPDLYDTFLFFDNGLKVRVKVGWIHYVEGGVESSELFNGFEGQIINNRSTKFYTQQGWRLNFGKEPSFDELRHHQDALRKRGIGTRIIRREPLATGWNQGIACGLEIPTGEAPNRELLEFVLDAILENTLEPESWKDWQGEGPLPTGEVALENVRIIHAIEKSAQEGVPVDISRD